jgi:hypothetical protein
MPTVFPLSGNDPGISLRELFAAMAMNGWLAMCADSRCASPTPEETAKNSVRIADALMAELAKERKP